MIYFHAITMFIIQGNNRQWFGLVRECQSQNNLKLKHLKNSNLKLDRTEPQNRFNRIVTKNPSPTNGSNL